MELKNIRLDIEYDGTDFFGWQRQSQGVPTIQALLEDAISVVEGRSVDLYGAGRTDSGVHARGQVANFASRYPVPPSKWPLILNRQLPRTIRIREAREVETDFHAQRSAVSKIYEYRILNRAFSSAFDRWVLFYPHRLDWDAIREAMSHFLGRHDFKAFQAAGATVKTTERTLTKFQLHDEGGGYYRFQVEGNGFLKQMVRNIIGTLLEVGEGKRPPDDIPRIFASRDRRQAGRTAPPSGLCLVRVLYPPAEGAC